MTGKDGLPGPPGPPGQDELDGNNGQKGDKGEETSHPFFHLFNFLGIYIFLNVKHKKITHPSLVPRPISTYINVYSQKDSRNGLMKNKNICC